MQPLLMNKTLITKKKTLPYRVLSIDPLHAAFGYAVLEGTQLLDAGMRFEGKGANTDCLSRAIDLMQHSRPHILVLEDTDAEGSRRGKRVRMLLWQITQAAIGKNVRV